MGWWTEDDWRRQKLELWVYAIIVVPTIICLGLLQVYAEARLTWDLISVEPIDTVVKLQYRFPAVAVALVLAVFGPPIGWVARVFWWQRRRQQPWVQPTLKALTAGGFEPHLLETGDIAFTQGVFERGEATLRVELVAPDLPEGHLSRATVLPGGNIELGVPAFDELWRIRSEKPVELALALGPRAQELLDRLDSMAIRDGHLEVVASRGHPTTFIRSALDLRDALLAGAWQGLELDDLHRTPTGFEGARRLYGVEVELVRHGPPIHTRISVRSDLPISASLQPRGRASTGNIVVDQLIGVRGHVPEDAVEPLLELVHGKGARIDNGHLVIEVPGVLVDELDELVDRCIDLLDRLSRSTP
ncbi:MAG: hypothetical protein GY884_05260 [Proteobacteria bacterium]|nr:hypothetical protein [Pseudomonadota bacterium]